MSERGDGQQWTAARRAVWDGAVDLDLTDDQELLRETTARFLEADCPLTKVRALADSDLGVEPDYLTKGAELGWFAMLVSEEDGGGSISEHGLLDAAIIAEERGRALQPGPFVPTNVVAAAIAAAGTEDQRAKVLPDLIAGTAPAAWAIATTGGDWSPGLAVRATATGVGFRLSGAAGVVQDGHLAEWLLVTAAGPEGLSQFLLPASTPGVTVTPLDSLDLTRRFAEVSFDDVEVGAEALVGEADGAAEQVERQLQIAAVLTTAESVGAMRHIFDITLDYAKARTAFGRPIGSFQAIKHLLADTGMLLEMSTGTAAAAARAVAHGDADAAQVASIAKAMVGDHGVALSQNCFQVFGGIGYTWEHDQHLFLRRLATDAMLYGDPAWHRERLCQIHGL